MDYASCSTLRQGSLTSSIKVAASPRLQFCLFEGGSAVLELWFADLKLEKIDLSCVAHWKWRMTLSSKIHEFLANNIPQEMINGRPFNSLKTGYVLAEHTSTWT